MSANSPPICSKCDKRFETERDLSYHNRRCGNVRKRKISILDVSPSKLVQLLDQYDANRDRFDRDDNVCGDDGNENIQLIATQPSPVLPQNASISVLSPNATNWYYEKQKCLFRITYGEDLLSSETENDFCIKCQFTAYDHVFLNDIKFYKLNFFSYILR